MSILPEKIQRAREAAYQVRLRVSPKEALGCMEGISHESFLKALRNHWIVDENGCATMQSICWLFCWAKTGTNSTKTAYACSAVFSKIFNHPYEWFDREVPHELARKWRNEKPKRL